MDDVRQFLLSVAVDVVHTVPLCQQHIDLDRNDRIFFSEYVLVLDVQLRSVECRLIDTDIVLYAQVVQDLLHSSLCHFPLLRSTFVFVVRVGRIPLGETESTVVQQSYRAQEIFAQIQTSAEFFFQLVRTDHQMALGDRELSYTDQAVHLTGILVTEQGRCLTQTHRQVTVASFTV